MDATSLRKWLEAPSNVQSSLPKGVQVTEVICAGGQGMVYRGTVMNSNAAVKIYYPGQIEKRIEREVDALRSIDCPSIVKLLLAGTVSVPGHRLALVATSFVSGRPLDKILLKGALSMNQVSVLVYDVAAAVDQMWNHKIVHRDLKPSNIIITPRGRACVIDLGVARHLEHSSLTAVGVTWGTYGYLSPEQTRCVRQLTCKSDLFSLGVIVVESVMGRHPTSGDQLRLLALDLHDRLPPDVEGWEHAGLLKRLLHPRPTMRPMPVDVLKVMADYALGD